MYCNFKNENCLRGKFNLKNFGASDLERVKIDGSDRTQLNWNEISVPEILKIPCQKPDMEQLEQVFVDTKLINVKLIETPFAYKIYDRRAAQAEITLAGGIPQALLMLVGSVVQVIVNADNVLAVPPSVVPEVIKFEQARNDVFNANIGISNARGRVLRILNSPCLCAQDMIRIDEIVTASIDTLINALNDLSASGTDLQAASTTDISAEITVMNLSIATTMNLISQIKTRLMNLVDLASNSKYLEIIENEEGTCLSGRKLVIEGVLIQKILYTALVSTQSVHSAHYKVPFTAYIIPYAKFKGLIYEEDVEVITAKTAAGCETKTINGFAYNPGEPIEVDVCEEFNVDVYIEDIFATMLDYRTIFKNITLFFLAKPVPPC